MMRTAFVSVLVLATQVTVADEPKDSTRVRPSVSKPDRSYGTAIQWESDLRRAAKQAERQRKLVLVLAVAGHFEDPFFT